MAKPLRALQNWIGELFTRTALEHDGRWKDRDVMIVAHRGAACDHPENTIASLDAAIDCHKCAAVEIDLCFTRDGHVVLWHDWDPNDAISLARQSGFEEAVRCRPSAPGIGSPFRRPVHELDLDDLRTHYGYGVKSMAFEKVEADIPTLDEFFTWATKRGDVKHVHFDIKIPPGLPEYVERMMACIDEL
ncbi:MAG: hypothetical protein H7X80_11810, partial [bacterium]|nr:hypothetical protein [Candidatus Kapabacteria bacterium]